MLHGALLFQPAFVDATLVGACRQQIVKFHGAQDESITGFLSTQRRSTVRLLKSAEEDVPRSLTTREGSRQVRGCD